MRSLLVLRGGALGDLIVTLPLLEALRKRWPGSRIELCGNQKAAVLALEAGLLDQAHDQNEARWGALYSADPLPSGFASFLRGFDLVMSFWPDPAGDIARRFPLRPDQVFLSGGAEPQTSPASRHFLAPLAPFGVLNPARNVILRHDVVPTPRLVLHPGSGSRRKNWPIEHWQQLAARLFSEFTCEIAVVCGLAETQLPLGPDYPTYYDLPLPALTDLLSTSALFIGHDSGVSHLAAAAGTPSLLLFGPTNPARWAPPGLHVHVVHEGPELASLSVETVFERVRLILRPLL